jgi:hypothetical protein
MSSFFLIRSSRGSLMNVFSVRLATAADHPTLERLWLMFRHDMSEFRASCLTPMGPSGMSGSRPRSPIPAGRHTFC